jgi:pimeloyl-ACP methyl ester carboxylesterase
MQEHELNGIANTSGPAGAPVILFLHGLGWNRKMWLYQQQALEKEFLVVTLDLPGHGSQIDRPFQFEEAVRIVMHTADAITASKILLVGLSLGGYVAITCAHRHPERIAGLIIAGSCVLYQGWLGVLARLNGLLLSRVYSEKALVQMQEQSVMSTYPADYARPIVETGFRFKTSGRAFTDLAGKNFRAQLHTYYGPVLILNGEHDARNRKAEQAMLASAQNGQLLVIENAGHLCNMDQPASFTSAVAGFAHTISWETP